jgi:hypothetical protein
MNLQNRYDLGPVIMQKQTIVLAAVILLFANFAAAAQEARFPNLDTQKLCRNRAKSSEEMMGDKTVSSKTYDTCMRSEGAARKALVDAWKDIPPNYKAACIKPEVYSASYEEWIACLESNIDVKGLRKKP